MGPSSNGKVQMLIWLALVTAFLLSVFGAGYAKLETTKADKEDVQAMAEQIRDIHVFLLGKAK